MLSNKERMQWYALGVATIVLLIILGMTILSDQGYLNDTFIFFCSVLGMVLGAGIYKSIKGDKDNGKT